MHSTTKWSCPTMLLRFSLVCFDSVGDTNTIWSNKTVPYLFASTVFHENKKWSVSRNTMLKAMLAVPQSTMSPLFFYWVATPLQITISFLIHSNIAYNDSKLAYTVRTTEVVALVWKLYVPHGWPLDLELLLKTSVVPRHSSKNSTWSLQ